MKEIEIYKSKDGKTEVEVTFDQETVWLTQKQMADLFQSTVPNINTHIKNLYTEKELFKKSTVKKSLIVQIEGKRRINRAVDTYNLDVIISVGYRVKSKQGVLFRQWATQKIKEYLVQGFAINQLRLNQLKQTVQIIQKGIKDDELNVNEAKGIIEIISNYTNSFILLNHYDSNKIVLPKLNDTIIYEIRIAEAREAIKELKKSLIKKKEATELFGNEKDRSFEGILGNIIQSFGGEYVYKSVEEQAAHLLFFIIKNHPFTDGNKRIGAFIFVWFLTKNKHHFKKNGELKINDNALVAVALLVAQSNPDEKEIMIALVVNLINSR
jgi:death-on-curing family protein